jgi:hypothetical protein
MWILDPYFHPADLPCHLGSFQSSHRSGLHWPSLFEVISHPDLASLTLWFLPLSNLPTCLEGVGFLEADEPKPFRLLVIEARARFLHHPRAVA